LTVLRTLETLLNALFRKHIEQMKKKGAEKKNPSRKRRETDSSSLKVCGEIKET
jgi:hypothetical protein